MAIRACGNALIKTCAGVGPATVSQKRKFLRPIKNGLIAFSEGLVEIGQVVHNHRSSTLRIPCQPDH
ncbi:protein of unknown function (plasmid) [Cupriavidus taiwanensis]|uniref:Uncharacterized protein n=1 Tax=Cupriavidus taiwanensis TaxID=164546 RepID=A0A375I742_9BURK|nr:hypothetical protein CT19425_U610010 [Cupriavidus taiwanensis]SPK77771.1 protein of unknown function [Cupriavidus taiwanensis]